MPQNVLQTLKKKCSPTFKKSFKERNPDVDMDEIQNNPNVPDDVKAAISGALTLTLEDEEGEVEEEAVYDSAIDTEQSPHSPAPFDSFEDDYIMEMSEDDGKSKKHRRKHADDDDWQTSRRRPNKTRRKKSKKNKHKKKSKKRDSENVEQQLGDERSKAVKIKQKRIRKSADEINKSNELNKSMNTTCTSITDIENLNVIAAQSMENDKSLSVKSIFENVEATKRENKPKKAPKKRDSTDRPANGVVKTIRARRQVASIESYIECIEAVVRESAALHDGLILSAVRDEPNENEIEPNVKKTLKIIAKSQKPLSLSQQKQKLKVQHSNKMNGVSPESKVKTKRKSSTTKVKQEVKQEFKDEFRQEVKDALHMGKVDQTCFDKCASMNSLMAETTIKKPTHSTPSTKQVKNSAEAAKSMKKVTFIS